MGSPYHQNVDFPDDPENSVVIYRKKDPYDPYNSIHNRFYEEDPADNIAILSLILGLLSLMPPMFYWGVFAWIFAFEYKKKGNGLNRGKTVAGRICGALGFLIGSFAIMFLIVNWDRVKEVYSSMYQ